MTAGVGAVAEPIVAGIPQDDVAAVRQWGAAAIARQRAVLDCAVVVCTYRRPAAVSRFLDSLRSQARPAQLIVIDASPDDATEREIASRTDLDALAARGLYLRVAGRRRGLTRQRNLALDFVEAGVVAFFDDDVVLGEQCLAEMSRLHREGGPAVVGVGSFSASHVAPPPALWRWRRRLGVVSGLEPGRYCRSGMSVPWSWLFLGAGTMPIEGDWLPGYAMSWKTDIARAERFDEVCGGYGQGEDLEFSLRAKRHGRLLMMPSARLEHIEEPAGRPAPFALGYMAVYNRYRIHRRALTDRTWGDVAWFAYAWALDTVLLGRGLFGRARRGTLAQIAGRARAACDIVAHRGAA